MRLHYSVRSRSPPAWRSANPDRGCQSGPCLARLAAQALGIGDPDRRRLELDEVRKSSVLTEGLDAQMLLHKTFCVPSLLQAGKYDRCEFFRLLGVIMSCPGGRSPGKVTL